MWKSCLTLTWVSPSCLIILIASPRWNSRKEYVATPTRKLAVGASPAAAVADRAAASIPTLVIKFLRVIEASCSLHMVFARAPQHKRVPNRPRTKAGDRDADATAFTGEPYQLGLSVSPDGGGVQCPAVPPAPQGTKQDSKL